jgi:hypothetical protein
MKNQRIATSKFLSKRRQNVPSNPEYRSSGSSSIKELWRHFDEKQRMPDHERNANLLDEVGEVNKGKMGEEGRVRVEKQVNVKGYVSVQV